MSFDPTPNAITGTPRVESIQRNFEVIDANFLRALEQPSGLTDGDLLYWDNGVLKRLPIGDDDQVLTLDDGLPAWVDTQATTVDDFFDLDMQTSAAYVCLGATVNAVGFAAASTTGTLASANDTATTYVSFTTGGVSGNGAGLTTPAATVARRQYNPTLIARVKTGGAVSSIRLWVGFIDTTPFNDADDLGAATRSAIAFRFSSVAGDTKWVGVCADGADQTVSAGIGSAVAVDTSYKLKIRVDSAAGKAYFSIDDGTETEVAANLPATTTQMSLGARVITQTAGARVLLVNRMQIRYGS